MADTFTSKYGLTKPGNLDAAGAGLWGPKLNTDFDLIDGEIWLPRLPFNAPTVGATTTCDLSLARIFAFTVTQITTIAFSNVPVVGGSNFSTRIRIILTNGSAFAVTWPASVTWLSGTAPTLKASGVDEVELVTKDAGTNWYAAMRGDTRFRVGTSTAVAKPSLLLYQNFSLTTSATVDTSLATYSLPANALATNGDRLRVYAAGSAVTQNGTFNLKFGATQIIGSSDMGVVVAGNRFSATAYLVRTGAATQVSNNTFVNNTATQCSRVTPAETLSGAITIDIRGNLAAGGATLTYDHVTVEYLPA